MAVILIAAAAAAPRSVRYVMNMKAQKEDICICVDAGHGGGDPGKVGVSGVQEKDVNLRIALKLKTALEKEGYRVVMTREDDTDLADDGAGSRKVSDMRNRCERIREAGPALTISIHQNSYGDSSVKGAQVFYYGSSTEGKALAEALQESLIRVLDPDNHRAAKANESYYMLKKTSVPTVIVECGFLSNPEEEADLQNSDYQEKVVKAVCDGVKEYLSQ